jgi:hypothetical protein
MTTTATITQLRVPQTFTVPFGATTPVRFDALLEMVTSVIVSDTSSGECCGMMETAAFKAAHGALWTFADDCVTNDHVIVREFAMALAKMMSSERLSLEDSTDVAYYVNQLSMQNDLPAFMDWSARDRHARHTASLMFALINKRRQSSDLPQHAAGAEDLH